MRFSTYPKTLLALTGVSLAFYVGCSSGGGNGGGNSVGNGASSSGGSSASGGSSGDSGSGASSSGGGLNLGGSGNGSGNGGSGVIDPDAGCATSTQKGSLVPANLLFVVDRSGSMNCNLPQDVPQDTTSYCESHPVKLDNTKPSKWESTVSALEKALGQLQKSSTIDVRAGLVVFPADGSNCSVNNTANVPIKKLDSAQLATLSTFLDNESPAGSTPLAGADIKSYAYIVSQWQNLPGNKFVVLLTDGFESCSPGSLPGLLETDIPQATQIGIKTFVIGVPGSEDGRALLSEMAHLGGTDTAGCTHVPDPPPLPPLPPASGANVGDCHFDMTTATNFSQALQDALTKISGTVLSCELDVPTNPSGGGVDTNKVNVTINGNLVQPDGQNGATCGAGANGWQYNSTKTKIELCGQACTDAKQTNATVQVVLGCPTGTIQ